MMSGERWTMFSTNFRAAFEKWTAETGGGVESFANAIQESKYTVANWLSPTNPSMPRADKAARAARILGTTVETLAAEELADLPGRGEPASAPTAPPIYSAPYADIIAILNRLSPDRLDDVRRLIGKRADEIRGASQNTIDIVADLKVLPPEWLEDLRVLLPRWEKETSSPESGMSSKEVSARAAVRKMLDGMDGPLPDEVPGEREDPVTEERGRADRKNA